MELTPFQTALLPALEGNIHPAGGMDPAWDNLVSAWDAFHQGDTVHAVHIAAGLAEQREDPFLGIAAARLLRECGNALGRVDICYGGVLFLPSEHGTDCVAAYREGTVRIYRASFQSASLGGSGDTAMLARPLLEALDSALHDAPLVGSISGAVGLGAPCGVVFRLHGTAAGPLHHEHEALRAITAAGLLVQQATRHMHQAMDGDHS